MVTVGGVVCYVDEHAQRHNALVTAVWGDVNVDPYPSINCTYVSNDESKTDQYGRQLMREATSRVHKSKQAAYGSYWEGV